MHILSRHRDQAVIVAAAAIFGLTYGLSAPLIALNLVQRGFSETVVGFNAGMHAAGVLVVALTLPRLADRWGIRPLILLALAVAAIVLVAFAGTDNILFWFILRFFLGAASEILFVVTETWLNHLTDENRRARTMAIYMAALSSGFALGPLILAGLGAAGPAAFLAGGAIALLPLLLLCLVRPQAPRFDKAPPERFWTIIGYAPVAVASTALNAAVETAGLSFLALYALSMGWQEDQASLLVSILLIGAIVLQPAIGWLGDKMDRRKLIGSLAIAACVGALIWPSVISIAWLAYALLFVWGGVFVGIYTITLTLVGATYSGGKLMAIYAILSLAWGGGALIGPIGAGIAMGWTAHGLPLFVATISGLFALLVLLRRQNL